MKAEAGDKVRLKIGADAGERGLVQTIDGGKLTIRLEKSNRQIRVLPEQVTNYSLAARKAWVTEPDRAVGRRKGTKLVDRISVTLRIDRDLWEHFLGLEAAGIILDRTALVNGLLREKLAQLDGDGPKK